MFRSSGWWRCFDPARSQAHHPLFQVALFFQNMAQGVVELPGLSIAGFDAGVEIAKFDLQLTVTPVEEDGVGVGMPDVVDVCDGFVRRVDGCFVCGAVGSGSGSDGGGA